MQNTATNPKKTIVLVHGAFADASGWNQVIALLQHQGYNVVAVQNPLTSLTDDVATTKRLIDAQEGAVIVVGHSYGGVVITDAASGNANVKALVYIAAFAPAPGENPLQHSENYAPPLLLSSTVPDAAGFVYIDTAKFHEVFANDLPEVETNVMAVTQKPLHGSAFGATVVNAAWQSVPTWYMVAQQDNAINPEFERFLAGRMGAHTVEVESSHVPFLSHPQKVVDLILEAAAAV